MSPDRKNRTPNEVTADILIKRLTVKQLLPLWRQSEYSQFHDKILEVLQAENNLLLDDFKDVHTQKDCVIEETETGDTVRAHGDTEFGNWAENIPEKKSVCKKHNVASIKYFIFEGGVYDERAYRRRY